MEQQPKLFAGYKKPKKKFPMWVKFLIGAGGLFIIVGAIAVISGEDKDHSNDVAVNKIGLHIDTVKQILMESPFYLTFLEPVKEDSLERFNAIRVPVSVIVLAKEKDVRELQFYVRLKNNDPHLELNGSKGFLFANRLNKITGEWVKRKLAAMNVRMPLEVDTIISEHRYALSWYPAGEDDPDNVLIFRYYKSKIQE